MAQGEYKTRGKWWWVVVARLSKQQQQQPAEWNEAFIKLPIKGTNMKKNINNILYSANWIHCTVWFVGYTCTCTYTYFTLFVWVCSKHVHEGFYLLNNERPGANTTVYPEQPDHCGFSFSMESTI